MRSACGQWVLGALGSVALFLTVGTVGAAAQTGTINTIAGGGANATAATSAYLPWPTSVALDKAGDLYVALAALDEVVKIDPTGKVTLVAGTGYAGYSGDNGPATSATLDLSNAYVGDAQGIALDGSGNLYIADGVNNVVRRVDAATGIITTVAGNGTAGYSGDGGLATSAALYFPMGLAVDGSGNLFVVDDGNNVVRRVGAATGIITTVAGNGAFGYSGDGGPATSATLNMPMGIGIDSSGNLYIADTGNNVVRRVDASTGIITTAVGDYSTGFSYSGDGGPATAASLNQPSAVLVDGSGNLWIADSGNEVIRRVDASTWIITMVAGDGAPGFSGDGGLATSAGLNLASNFLPQVATLALDSAGNLYIPDSWNMRIRVVNASTGAISTMAGGGTGGDGGLGSSSILTFPTEVASDGSGNLFIENSSDGRVRRIDAATGAITTVAGNGKPIMFASSVGDGGPATSANLASDVGLATDVSGNIFISDTLDNRIRRVDAVTGIITTVAGGTAGLGCDPSNIGDGGPATSACVNWPRGVAVDGSDNIYIADRGNHRVRKVDAATGIITTIAGNGTPGCSADGGLATNAEVTAPTSVALDSSGNVYFGDCRSIRRIDISTGIITTVAGNGSAVYSGDGGPATSAGLGDSRQILVDGLGNLLIADAFPNRIRRVDAFSGLITTIAGSGSSVLGGGSYSGDGGLATSATLNAPYGITLDASGNLLIADSGDNRIRKVALPPFVGFQPYAVSFPGQVLGISSTQTITLESTGTTALSISSLGIAGANATDFAISGSTCGPTLASGKTCTVSVTFTPTVLGAESAALNVPTDAISSPQTVGLTGTSIEPTSTTTVTSSANPSVLNQAVTLTAAVSSTAGGTPTGTVTFRDGSATLGTVALDGSGQATLTTSALGVGTHGISAQYSGDANFTASIGSVSQEVGYGICALYDQTRSVNGGAVFPIKVELCDASGNDISSAAIVLHATAITMVSGYVGVPETAGNANPDSDFRYDSTLGTTGGYIFNLSTSGLAAGTYSLQFTAVGDPVTHAVNFGVK